MTERQVKYLQGAHGDAITDKIAGYGGSIVLVAYCGEVCGMISISDMIKKGGRDAV